MSTHGPQWWQTVSPYLDRLLELEDEERLGWLASLRERNPSLAAHLEELLREYHELAEEHFLEQGPVLPLSAPPVQAGHAVGAYTLVSSIGEGGMGSVWLAERSDGRFRRRAAVKFLRAPLGGRIGQERFKREGSLLGRLAHPHIAELLDAGVSPGGQPYLILEYVDGEPIDAYCDRRRLDVEARVRLFLDVLAGVAHAHANLIVHRDLKPSNVLVRGDGQVKLLDFGIAKLLEHEGRGGAATQLTREGGSALTPEYASPEQLTGGPITTATDVYGLGVLLYVLLTGRHPAGPGPHSPADVVKAILDIEPPHPSDVVTRGGAEEENSHARAANRASSPARLNRALRGDLDTIVAKALKKSPQERYASATAMADDLRRYLAHQPISARPDTFAYYAARFIRRNRIAVALATLALVASLAGVAGILIQSRTARRERDFAFHQLLRAEATNDLERFILSDAAPSGKQFTVNELLMRAEQIVEREREENDSNRVELLISIGDQYGAQDEDANSRRVLEEAYKLSRGLSDPSVRAKAACALASTLAGSGQMRRTEALIREGLSEIPSGPQYALDRVYCLQRGSEVALDGGNASESIARELAALFTLRQSPFDSDLLEMGAMMGLAESYREAGMDRHAIAAFKQASALMVSLGRDDTETAGTLFNNWALTLDDLGRPLEAEPIFQRAINISRVDKSWRGVSPMLLLNYARILFELARLKQAATYAENSYALAHKAGDQVVINQALLLRARIYRKQHNLRLAGAMLAKVAPRLRSVLPPGHYAFAALATEQALLAQARGNAQRALKLANHAVAILEASTKAGGEGSEYLPVVLVNRSGIELDLQRPPEAEADASRALKLLEANAPAGEFSSNMGAAYLALGRALQAQAKHDEARAAFHLAAENLEKTLGPDHPDTRNARQLAGLDSPHP